MSELSNMIAGAADAPAFFNAETKKGTSIVGTIASVSVRQTRDPGTNKPQVWEDGSPMQQIVIVLTDTNADGDKSIYVKWWGEQRKRFAAAVLAAKRDEPTIGDTLEVTYVGEGTAKSAALNAPKLYDYVYGVAQ